MRSDLMRRYRRGREEITGGANPDLFGMASEEEARHLLEPTWETDRAEQLARSLPLIQGSYYLLTGLWPLVHMKSFERVTGRKTDKWLVRTVGSLAAAIGAGLLQAGRRGYLPRELRTVAGLAAAGFIAVEVPTTLRRRISPIYLADTVVELGFLSANVWAGRTGVHGEDEVDALVRRQAEEILDDSNR